MTIRGPVPSLFPTETSRTERRTRAPGQVVRSVIQCLRRAFFWVHFVAGCTFGVLILLVAGTGILLAFQQQCIAFEERNISAIAASPHQQYLPPEVLLRIAAHSASEPPAQLVYFARPDAPVMFQLDRFAVLYMNPYTGAVMGRGAVRTREAFRRIEGIHRWFGAWGRLRKPARQVKGAVSVGLLLLAISGLVLWWPRGFSWRHFRAVLWFRKSRAAHARNWNWHNVIGIWTAVPLIVVLVTGIILQYEWASALVYTASGNPVPGPDHVFRPAGARALLRSDANWAPAAERALHWESGWKTVTMNVPDERNKPITFILDRGNAGQPTKQGVLEIDSVTGAVVSWTPFSAKNRGERLRELARWTHTGQSAGLPGQILALLAAAGAGMLAFTGLSLATTRLRSWLFRTKRRSTVQRPS